MSKRFMLVVMVVMVVTLVSSLAIVTSVLSQSAKKESKSVTTPPACVCSDVSFLTYSDDALLKFGVDKDEIEGLKESEQHLRGSIFNCQCGKTQCVAAASFNKMESNSVSCIKGSLF